MNIDDIYTPLEDAIKEIKKRSQNRELKKDVELFLDDTLPDIFQHNTYFCFTRHIHSPNYELMSFLSLADKNDFQIKLLEYSKDKFTAKNNLKYYLGKMYFDHGIGKRGGKKISSKAIIDLDRSDGKKICTVKTIFGDSLVDFHHKLLSLIDVDAKDAIFDISDWLESRGSKAESYYISYLSLFMCHAILFENFLIDGGGEEKLTRNIVLPAIQKMQKKFGCKPLIVRLIPKGIENDPSSSFYPQKIIDHFKAHYKL